MRRRRQRRCGRSQRSGWRGSWRIFWSVFRGVERAATFGRLGDREGLLQIAILGKVELERVAGRLGRHDMRESAQVALRNSHPECGCGLIEREQRVAGRDERQKLERVRAEHPAGGGGMDRVVKLTPLVEEN